MIPEERKAFFASMAGYIIVFDAIGKMPLIVILSSLLGIAIPYFNKDIFKEFRHKGLPGRKTLIFIVFVIMGLNVTSTTIILCMALPEVIHTYSDALTGGLMWLAVGVFLDKNDDEGNKVKGGISAKIKDLVDKIRSVHGTRPPVALQPAK